jgi:hypothetical protein
LRGIPGVATGRPSLRPILLIACYHYYLILFSSLSCGFTSQGESLKTQFLSLI